MTPWGKFEEHHNAADCFESNISGSFHSRKDLDGLNAAFQFKFFDHLTQQIADTKMLFIQTALCVSKIDHGEKNQQSWVL